MNNPFDRFGGRRFPIDPSELQGLGLKQIISMIAPAALPQLEQLNNPVFRMIIESAIDEQYAAISEDMVSAGLPFEVEMALADAKDLSFNDIREQVEASRQKMIDSLDQIELTAGARTFGLSEDEFVTFQNAMRSVLPKALLEFSDAINLKTSSSVEEAIRKNYRMSDAEALAYSRTTYESLPVDEVAQAMYEVIQKATPEALTTALQELTSRVTAADLSDVVFGGVDFAKDLIETVSETDKLAVSDPSAAAAFAASVRKVIGAVGDSLTAAGLTPDTDLAKPFADAAAKIAGATPPSATPKPKKPGNGKFDI